MSHRLGARRGHASVVLASAVLTIVTLTSVIFVLSVEGNTVGSNAGMQTGSQRISPNHPGGPVAAAASSTCPLPSPSPPDPIGGFGYLGTLPFTFVGANSTCVAIAPSTSAGSMSSASFMFTLNASKPLIIGMAVSDRDNGTLAVPHGTTYNATVISQTISVPDEPTSSTPSQPLVNLPVGETTIDFRVSVPNPYPVSTYHFFVVLNVFSDSRQSYPSYENLFEVNLVAQ